MSADLLSICLSAILAVFILLGLLAVVMQVITTLFPQASPRITTTHVAVISTAAQSFIPGAKVVKIEEKP